LTGPDDDDDDDDDRLHIEYDSGNDPYQQDLDAWKEGELISQ
jgi:hypothetical protein